MKTTVVFEAVKEETQLEFGTMVSFEVFAEGMDTFLVARSQHNMGQYQLVSVKTGNIWSEKAMTKEVLLNFLKQRRATIHTKATIAVE